jgi:hypothetical protein
MAVGATGIHVSCASVTSQVFGDGEAFRCKPAKGGGRFADLGLRTGFIAAEEIGDKFGRIYPEGVPSRVLWIHYDVSALRAAAGLVHWVVCNSN